MTVDVVDTTMGATTALAAGIAEQADVRRPKPERALRPLLVFLDAATLFGGWFTAVFVAHRWPTPLWAGASSLTVAACATVAGIATAALSRLYRARVCSVRTVEVGLLVRVTVVSAVVAGLVGSSVGVGWSTDFFIVSMIWLFMLLNVERGMFAYWVRSSRGRGRFARPIVIVGANDEGRELYHLLATEPELGYQVVGVIGDPADAAVDWPAPWLGDGASAVDALRANGVTGCVMAVSAFTMVERTALLNDLLDNDIHVQVSSGIARVDHHRLRAVPLGREPAFYLERNDPSPWQRIIKRMLDLSIVIACAPVMLLVVSVAAIAIKLDSRGSIIYRQTRIGRGGRPFTMYKLRTMVTAADQQLAELAQQNERTDGPLFKLESDPRVTRVGRLLRATSIDELPQLWCVLVGTMSLVGPRPPLAEEVAHFDTELRTRFDVTPGITGLWQVEARDNPSFRVYRRYDLFYVENWSVRLDFAILIRTFESVVTRAFVGLRRGGDAEEPTDVVAAATGEL
ncbi:MAG TPA: sugar transferase [Acidimicrobiales bacterium]|jgi:exopolysaccharide biosynthesis polyprenyl glycosylphosphotransferase|nr:sugar transferase [Acidimicrobiales bacterium]